MGAAFTLQMFIPVPLLSAGTEQEGALLISQCLVVTFVYCNVILHKRPPGSFVKYAAFLGLEMIEEPPLAGLLERTREQSPCGGAMLTIMIGYSCLIKIN